MGFAALNPSYPLSFALRVAGRCAARDHVFKLPRSCSKLASIAPSSTRPRGSLILNGSTKRPLIRIS